MKAPGIKSVLRFLLYIVLGCILLFILAHILGDRGLFFSAEDRVMNTSGWSSLIVTSAAFLVAVVAIVFVLGGLFLGERIEARSEESKTILQQVRDSAKNAQREVEERKDAAIDNIKSLSKQTGFALQEYVNRRYELHSAIFQSQEAYEKAFLDVTAGGLDKKNAQILISLMKQIVESTRLQHEISLLFYTQRPTDVAHLIQNITSSSFPATALNVLKQYLKRGLLRDHDGIQEELLEAIGSLRGKLDEVTESTEVLDSESKKGRFQNQD